MSRQAKPVWDALTSKADMALRKAQNIMDAALARKNEAELRLVKIDDLLADYTKKLNKILARSHHSQETDNYRRFILQLQALRQRAEQDRKVFDLDYGNAQKVVIAADQEKLKLQRLADRAKTKLQEHRRTSETKEAEAHNITHFNLTSRIRR